MVAGVFFVRLLHILPLILTMACGSDFSLTPKGPHVPTLEDAEAIDLLLVLDTSCSMAQDWPVLTYGLAAGLDELATTHDVRARITSACASDETWYPAVDGWDLVTAIPKMRLEGCENEEGLQAALDKRDLPEWSEGGRATAWTPEALDVVIFVSDEKDQGNVTPDEFLDEWQPFWITAIVGPDDTPGPGCTYDRGDGYLEVADKVISVCVDEPWTIF